ncbi:MAG: LacI family DNA-binding transcriptional regulator [Fimbriimonadaceae bacterium]
MKTRLKDIASQLKLSPALVSGVLNNRPNAWASAETRSRILHAARELNYQPSAAARALSRGRTETAALVYRRLQGAGFRLAYTGLVDVFSAELQAVGHDLMVSNFATQDEVLEHLERLVRTRSAEAYILWGREQDTEAQGMLLESLRAPFLVKGRYELTHPGWHQIDFDHEGMMAQAVKHLVSLGHRRLAYIGFAHSDAFVQALRRGFVQAHLEAIGAAPDPLLIGACDDDVVANEAIMGGWLDLPAAQRPTAFVIGAGNAAWLSLETCLAQTGRSLDVLPGEPAAAGIASESFTLMFGRAVAYQGIELDNLARFGSPHLIDSLLHQNGREPIIRFLPQLTEAPTLRLLKHGVTFSCLREAGGGQ